MEFQFAVIDLPEWLDRDLAFNLLKVLAIIAIGFVVLRILAALTAKMAGKKLSPQGVMVTRKVVLYGGYTLILFTVLRQMGFDLSAIMGAAGIAGVAIGFASQTSVSNLISGLFLVSEKPFEVGNVIEVAGTLGEVSSVDLLSTKVRTFDNRYVRIPNEMMIKEQVVNLTRFPIRRYDFQLGVAYKEDTRRVEAILREVAGQNPLVLDDPEPIFVFKNFGDSALEIQFSVWFVTTDYLKVKSNVLTEIKERFDVEGIEIPFPHLSLYAGSVTQPFPVKSVEK